jgi:2-amino-1-hydroxyethylphosphonate dioxygenase (glycine-forming)
MPSPQSISKEIFELFEAHGAEEYAGEKVSQLEHMHQAAALARQEGHDDEVVLAAFLHDIGHLLPAHDEHDSMIGTDGLHYGMVDHEKVGAEWLRKLGFGERMCRLIESHVNAKRYLTFKYPAYYEKLSAASKQTLEFQGGRMLAAEAAAFEADELFPLFIQMRKWDEAAKETNLPKPNLDQLKTTLQEYLQKRTVAY